jgi:hypothetical protein
MRRKIEEQEQAAMERASEQSKAQQKMAEQQLQAQAAAAQAQMEQTERMNIRDNETKIAMALISKEEGADEGDNGAAAEALNKLDLEKRKLDVTEKKVESDIDMNKRKQGEVERSNKSKEAIARAKPASTPKK